jgi:hypothetical protein
MGSNLSMYVPLLCYYVVLSKPVAITHLTTEYSETCLSRQWTLLVLSGENMCIW